MRKYILLSLLMLISTSLTACAQSKAKQAATKSGDYVEVLYFHGKQRCVTCRAIEHQTRELLNSQFGKQLKNKQIVLRVVDISESANKSLAQKYKVSWSSLFVVSHKGGKESVSDLTQAGFSYARSNPEKFRRELSTAITNHLR